MNCSARFCSLRDCSVLRPIVPPRQRQLSPGTSATRINITAVQGGLRSEGLRKDAAPASPICHPAPERSRRGGIRSAPQYASPPTPRQTESNSPDFHEIAILLQSPAPMVMAVALLTGRVYQDGLGGLRAVLFILRALVATHSQVRVRHAQPLLRDQPLG